MLSNDFNILQLHFKGKNTYAVLNIDCLRNKALNEVDVEKALPLAIAHYKNFQFKAVVFILEKFTLENHPFRFKCQKLCQIYGYYCYITSLFEIRFNSVLSIKKIMVNPDENIVFSFASKGVLSSFVFIRGESSYCYKEKMVHKYDTEKNEIDVLKLISEEKKAKKIIYHNSQIIPKNKQKKKEFIEMFKKTFPACDLLVLEGILVHSPFETSYIKVLDAMGEEKNTYLIDPMLASDFTLFHNNDCLINENGTISLPYEKSITFKVESKDDYLKEEETQVIEKNSLAEFVDKEVKLTMKIDKNYIYSISIDPAEVEKAAETISIDQSEVKKIAEAIPKSIKLDDNNKARIILTPDNYSILIPKEGKLCPLKIDGKEKAPLYITFVDKKVVIGQSAKKMLKEKPKFVIYDLIKLCSITDSKDANPQWPFLVKQDENKKILIYFERDDRRKQTTPAFLLALIFRVCLDLIQKETGKEMDEHEIEIEICGVKHETKLLKTM